MIPSFARSVLDSDERPDASDEGDGWDDDDYLDDELDDEMDEVNIDATAHQQRDREGYGTDRQRDGGADFYEEQPASFSPSSGGRDQGLEDEKGTPSSSAASRLLNFFSSPITSLSRNDEIDYSDDDDVGGDGWGDDDIDVDEDDIHDAYDGNLANDIQGGTETDERVTTQGSNAHSEGSTYMSGGHMDPDSHIESPSPVAAAGEPTGPNSDRIKVGGGMIMGRLARFLDAASGAVAVADEDDHGVTDNGDGWGHDDIDDLDVDDDYGDPYTDQVPVQSEKDLSDTDPDVESHENGPIFSSRGLDDAPLVHNNSAFGSSSGATHQGDAPSPLALSGGFTFGSLNLDVPFNLKGPEEMRQGLATALFTSSYADDDHDHVEAGAEDVQYEELGAVSHQQAIDAQNDVEELQAGETTIDNERPRNLSSQAASSERDLDYVDGPDDESGWNEDDDLQFDDGENEEDLGHRASLTLSDLARKSGGFDLMHAAAMESENSFEEEGHDAMGGNNCRNDIERDAVGCESKKDSVEQQTAGPQSVQAAKERIKTDRVTQTEETFQKSAGDSVTAVMGDSHVEWIEEVNDVPGTDHLEIEPRRFPFEDTDIAGGPESETFEADQLDSSTTDPPLAVSARNVDFAADARLDSTFLQAGGEDATVSQLQSGGEDGAEATQSQPAQEATAEETTQREDEGGNLGEANGWDDDDIDLHDELTTNSGAATAGESTRPVATQQQEAAEREVDVECSARSEVRPPSETVSRALHFVSQSEQTEGNGRTADGWDEPLTVDLSLAESPDARTNQGSLALTGPESPQANFTTSGGGEQDGGIDSESPHPPTAALSGTGEGTAEAMTVGPCEEAPGASRSDFATTSEINAWDDELDLDDDDVFGEGEGDDKNTSLDPTAVQTAITQVVTPSPPESDNSAEEKNETDGPAKAEVEKALTNHFVKDGVDDDSDGKEPSKATVAEKSRGMIARDDSIPEGGLPPPPPPTPEIRRSVDANQRQSLRQQMPLLVEQLRAKSLAVSTQLPSEQTRGAVGERSAPTLRGICNGTPSKLDGGSVPDAVQMGTFTPNFLPRRIDSEVGLDELPGDLDGDATHSVTTLSLDGKPALINYNKLLKEEIAKRMVVQKHLTACEETIAELEGSNQELSASEAKLTEEGSQMQAQIESLKRENCQLSDELSAQKKMCVELEAEKDEEKLHLDRANGALRQLKSDYDAATARARRHEDEAALLRSKAEAASATTTETARLQSEVVSLKRTLDDKCSQLRVEANKVQKLQTDLANAERRYVSKASEDAQKAEVSSRELANLKEELFAAKEQWEQLSLDNEQRQTLYSKEKTRLETDNRCLTEKAGILQRERDQLSSQLESLTLEHQARIESSLHELSQLGKRVEFLQNEKTQLEMDVMRLSTDTRTSQDLSRELNALAERNDGMQQDLRASQDRCKLLQVRIDAAEGAKDKLTEDLQTMTSRALELEQLVESSACDEELRETVEKSEALVVDLKEKLALARDEKNEAIGQRRSAVMRCKELEEQVSAIRALQPSDKETKEREVALTTLQQENVALCSERDRLRRDYDDIKRHSEHLEKTASAEKENAMEQYAALRSERDRIGRDYDDLKRHNEELEKRAVAEKEDAMQQYTALRSERDRLRRNCDDLKRNSENLSKVAEAEKKDAMQQYTALCSERDRLRRDYDDLQRRFELFEESAAAEKEDAMQQYMTLAEDARSQASSLKEECAMASRRRDEAESHRDALETSMRELESHSKHLEAEMKMRDAATLELRQEVVKQRNEVERILAEKEAVLQEKTRMIQSAESGEEVAAKSKHVEDHLREELSVLGEERDRLLGDNEELLIQLGLLQQVQQQEKDTHEDELARTLERMKAVEAETERANMLYKACPTPEEFSRVKAQTDELRVRNSVLEEELTNARRLVESERSDDDNRFRVLERERMELQIEAQSLSSKLEDAKSLQLSERQEATSTISSLRHQVDELQTKEIAQERTVVEKNSIIGELKNKLEETIEALASKEKKIEEIEVDLLQRGLDLHAKEQAALEVGRLEERVGELEESLASKTKEVIDVEMRSQSLEIKLAAAHAELDVAREDRKMFVNAGAKTDVMSSSLEEMQQEMAKLRKELSRRDKRGLHVEDHLEEKESEVQSLRAQLRAAEEAWQASEAKLAQAGKANHEETSTVETNGGVSVLPVGMDTGSPDALREQIVALALALERSESHRADLLERVRRERRSNADNLRKLSENVKRFYATLSYSDAP